MKDKRILIVDDGSVNRLLVASILHTYGYNNISEASDGAMAIRKIESELIDFVFMDIQMPIMNGIAATRYIRDILKLDIPIIAITAYDSIDIESNGFNDLILKPCSVDKICHAIDKFLK